MTSKVHPFKSEKIDREKGQNVACVTAKIMNIDKSAHRTLATRETFSKSDDGTVLTVPFSNVPPEHHKSKAKWSTQSLCSSKSNIPDSPSTYSFTTRTNGFGLEDNDNDEGLYQQGIPGKSYYEVESHACPGNIVTPTGKQFQFSLPKTPESRARPEHRSHIDNLVLTKDDYSRERFETSMPVESATVNNDSFEFEEATFPQPKSPKKTRSSNSLNFLKSPFSSPSLRNHIGRRPKIEKQTSFRSVETKSTIDGGGSGDFERLRPLVLDEKNNDSQPEILQKLRNETLSKSSSVPHLPIMNSPRHRRSKTSKEIWNAPSPGASTASLPSPEGRKKIHNVANSLNSVPDRKSCKIPDAGLETISSMLLSKKHEQCERTCQRRPKQLNDSSSENSPSLRNSFRAKSPRSGSRRNPIPEDPLRSPHRFQADGRPTLPHALVATAAAARARRTSRSPSLGRPSRVRTTPRSRSPRTAVLDQDKYISNPKSPILMSPAPLTPEQIIQQIRAGNFRLKAADDDTVAKCSLPGRITLEVMGTNINAPGLESPSLPLMMPLCRTSSRGSSLDASIDQNESEENSRDENRIPRPSRVKPNASGSGRRSRTSGGALASIDAEESIRKARARIGQRRETKSRSPSHGPVGSASGYHNSARGDEPTKMLDRSTSSGRRSGRPRSRSQSKEPRSRLRRWGTSSTSDDLPELPGSAFRLEEQISSPRRSSRKLKDQSPVVRRSARNLYDHSPASRRSARTVSDSSSSSSNANSKGDPLTPSTVRGRSSSCGKMGNGKSEDYLVVSPIHPRK